MYSFLYKYIIYVVSFYCVFSSEFNKSIACSKIWLINNKDMNILLVQYEKSWLSESERIYVVRRSRVASRLKNKDGSKNKELVLSDQGKQQNLMLERNNNYFSVKRLLAKNRVDEAEETLLGFFKEYPNKKDRFYYYFRGVIYEKRGGYIKAIQNYLKAIEINPEYSKARNRLATLYFRLKKYTKAENHFHKAIYANPYNPFIQYNLGNFYFYIGDYTNSIKYLKNAIKYKANFGSAYQKLGIMMYHKKEYLEANKYLYKAIKFKKGSYITYYYIGLSYYNLENDGLAISNLERAIKMKSDFYEAIIQVGKIYQIYGEYLKAIASYQRAEAIDDEDNELKMWIAECYSELRNYDKATEIVKDLLKDDPGNEGLKEFLRSIKEKKIKRYLNIKDDYYIY